MCFVLYESKVLRISDYREWDTDPDKTKLIEDWPTPTCTRDVRKYLGLISCYRKFVPQISEKNYSLTQFLNGKFVKRDRSKTFVPVSFKWEHHQQKALNELKHYLLKDICLVHADYSEPFVLEIDASRGALGAVLSQKTNKDELIPVSIASQKTNKTESNYPAHWLEFFSYAMGGNSNIQGLSRIPTV